jgi:phosphohistidine phosphatase
MKHLTLLRHAHTETASNGQKDFDRALTSQGMREAARMAELIQQLNIIPDKIICSAARRAHTTALLVAQALQLPASKLLTHANIYSASLPELLSIIQSSTNCDRLMLVAHNPTISELADELARDTRVSALPTSGMVDFRFDISSWNELSLKSGDNVQLYSPSN